eukprot:668025-Rhodomonas_salina.2
MDLGCRGARCGVRNASGSETMETVSCSEYFHACAMNSPELTECCVFCLRSRSAMPGTDLAHGGIPEPEQKDEFADNLEDEVMSSYACAARFAVQKCSPSPAIASHCYAVYGADIGSAAGKQAFAPEGLAAKMSARDAKQRTAIEKRMRGNEMEQSDEEEEEEEKEEDAEERNEKEEVASSVGSCAVVSVTDRGSAAVRKQSGRRREHEGGGEKRDKRRKRKRRKSGGKERGL